MKHTLLILSVFCSLSWVHAQRLSTVFNDDFSAWRFDGASYKTIFQNDWDTWECDGSRMKTQFSNDWNNWEIGEVRMHTNFMNDFSKWTIEGHGKVIYLATTFHDDTERWSITGDAFGTIRTVFSNNYNQWEIEVEMNDLDEELQKAIVFIAIFTSFQIKL